MAGYNVAKAAATIHKHMCTCSKHGYTQGSTRWGTGRSGSCTVTTQGYTFKIPAGDYDCSSSVIKAWQLALTPTKYKGKLQNATYTGNMRSVFTKSGLFTWKPMSYTAKTGDIYLNESKHTSMCQTQVPDVLSEFLINEFGTITGGKVGDQTGRESVVRAYYSFPWNGILAYNGKADIKATTTTTTKKKSITTIAKEVIDGKWGNGDDRKKKLKAAGYDYATVQKEVNKLLGK